MPSLRMCPLSRRLTTLCSRRQTHTVKCLYRSKIRVQSSNPGNLLCVEKDSYGNYTLHANGTERNQNNIFKETYWMASENRYLCYIRWFSEEEDTEYRLAVEDGQLKLVKEVASKKSQKFKLVFHGKELVALKSVQTKEYISCDVNTNKVTLSKEFDNRVLFQRIVQV